jgi:hypothetical protein
MLLVHPTGHCDQQKPERVQGFCHEESNIITGSARPFTNNPLEMTFVEGDQEVETFPTKAPTHSPAHRVGLGGSHGRPQDSHPQVSETLVDVLSEDAVAIVDQEAVGMIARRRLSELLERPIRRRMGSYVLVENLPGSDLYDDKDVEGAEMQQ